MLYFKISLHIERGVKTVIIRACIVLALNLNIYTITNIGVSHVRVITIFSNFVFIRKFSRTFYRS